MGVKKERGPHHNPRSHQPRMSPYASRTYSKYNYEILNKQVYFLIFCMFTYPITAVAASDIS
jgi:hypothetical protein